MPTDDTPEHPFAKLTGGGQDYHERTVARANTAFEEGKVSCLLAAFKFNVRKAAGLLRDREEEERGTPNLTFRAFNDAYPTFPLLLGARRLDGVTLHTDTRAQLPALFKAFSQAPFVTAYEAFYEAVEGRAAGRKIGLVFPRKGFKNGLVIYAAGKVTEIPVGDHEAVLSYAGGTKKDRHWLIVRSYQRVLEALHNGGHGWRPDGS